MRFVPAAMLMATALCLQTIGHARAQPAEPANLERVTVAGRKSEVSRWLRAESPHFVVYSDAGEGDVAQLLDNLERLDHLLQVYTLPDNAARRPGEPREPKLTLYFHNSVTDLRAIDAHPPADAVGLYSSCAAGAQGFVAHLESMRSLGDEQLDKAPLNDTLSYAFEAYARHFLHRHTDIRVPASFIDGFAQYFSSVRFSARQMVVGRVPPGLGAYLKFLSDGQPYSLSYDDVLQGRLANARSPAGAAGVRLEYEAKAWLLAHYMLSSPENRSRLNRYLVAVGRGADPTAAFERVFGLQQADIADAMWRYGLKGLATLRVEQPPLPAVRVSFRSLPRSTGEFVLAHAALKACPTREEGESLLRRLASLAPRHPDDDLARLTLSRAQIGWGNPRDALAPLNALLQDDDANPEARYLLGLAQLRLAEQSSSAAQRLHAEAAQRELRRAREASPRSPEVALAAFRADVAVTGTPEPAVLDGVIAAWQGARDIDALGRSAALASAFAGQADAAHTTLDTLAQNGHDAVAAQWARQWRARLETGVSRGDILAEMRRDPVADVPFKTWTLDKASALQAVERGAGLRDAEGVMKEAARQNDSATGTAAPGSVGNR
ncbi:hypothetical protein ACG04Q_12180 [Roseateles sp. DXS20W]|uniref:Tetratricopeptide repeat protein n=1 Tax=Pelomonas lactea TaxID=3299030 RepID=A0ABW7GKJ3_9BURK